MGVRRHRPASAAGPARLGAAALAAGLGLGRPAHADILRSEPSEGERGYVAVEELSYEAIIEAGSGYSAVLKVRTALRNTSQSARDAVHAIGLPFASHVEGVAVVREGVWSPGAPTHISRSRSRRDPGSVYVRTLPAASRVDNPGAEVVAFGIAPGETVQIEVAVRVFPRLRGDMWTLDLPGRGARAVALAPNRRVLVRGLRNVEGFTVDGSSPGGQPFVDSRAVDTVTVAWPSHLGFDRVLEAQAEAMQGPAGSSRGTFSLHLRLGLDAPLAPDHVLFVVDHSTSTPANFDSSVLAVAGGLLEALPPETTFDAIGFNRTATPLLAGRPGFSAAGSAADRRGLTDALQQHPRAQGTDLRGAFVQSARRLSGVRSQALVVIATDGMFPSAVTASEIGLAFEDALGPRARRPDLVFVIDEPMLLRSGLPVDHPAAQVAGSLGARISLESLEQLRHGRAEDLLSTPRVLGALDIQLPPQAKLDDPVPPGLVAGSFVRLCGHYLGKPPRSVRIRGRLGAKQIRRKVRFRARSQPPEAFVATTKTALEPAAAEGFSAPPWYQARHKREAGESIAQAGRFGRARQKGFLDRELFRHYLTTRVLPRARACYNRGLMRAPELAGRVVLEMEVGKGEVMMVQVAENDLNRPEPQLTACLTEAAWRLDAPAGVRDQQIYRLRYPLRLVPPPAGNTRGSVTTIDDEVLERLLAQPLRRAPRP